MNDPINLARFCGGQHTPACRVDHQDTISCELAAEWSKESLGQFVYDDDPKPLSVKLTSEAEVQKMLDAVNRWYAGIEVLPVDPRDMKAPDCGCEFPGHDFLPSDMKASVDPEDPAGDIDELRPQRRDGGRLGQLPDGSYRIRKRTRPHLDPACRCDACTLWDGTP